MLGSTIGASPFRNPEYKLHYWLRWYKSGGEFEDVEITATDMDTVDFIDGDTILGKMIVLKVEKL